MKNNRYTVDYYITKNIIEKDNNLENYEIDHKYKMTTYLLSNTMSDSPIFFIVRKEFPFNKKPSKFDLLFFLEYKKFYEVSEISEENGIYFLQTKNFFIYNEK